MTIADIYSLYRSAGALTTDSRCCSRGTLFLALHGTTFDGNLFAVEALARGCSYAIVDAAPSVVDPSGDYHSRLIVVADTLLTYKALARLHRREYPIPVIGITGTNGKTTTKELLASVLGKRYRVLATEGNYNNDIGVPRTLLSLTAEHTIAIVEMGASHRGDIATLASTAEPTCGLITNIGVAHLAGFGSREGVRATKGELYDYLSRHDGYAFVDSSDGELTALAAAYHLRTIPYCAGHSVVDGPFLTVMLADGTLLHTQLVGDYNVQNVLAAVSVGRHFGVPLAAIKEAVEDYCPRNSRSQRLLTEDNELIIDAYNANPSSMAAAIAHFAQMATPRPKMLILGDMAELGAATAAEHQRIVALVQRYAFAEVWLVGSAFLRTAAPFPCFATVAAVREHLLHATPHERCILIKGSNIVGLSALAEML